jgi:hypothetical protein
VLVKNGIVIDGTGAAARHAEVAGSGGKINRSGDRRQATRVSRLNRRE